MIGYSMHLPLIFSLILETKNTANYLLIAPQYERVDLHPLGVLGPITYYMMIIHRVERDT